MFQEIFQKIKDAYPVVQQVAHHTPLDRSNIFSRMTGGEVLLKLECLQRTGSFKIRGARYAISQFKPSEKERGCVAASAGNHAQGVAYAATTAGIKSTIVMPELAPAAKIIATQGYGAEVILHGTSYDDAVMRAEQISAENGATFIHSFDNVNVIAGQGTIGLELIDDEPGLDIVLVPVGGGGLISGLSIAIKKIRPDIKIIGVQASGCPSMVESIRKGRVIEITKTDTIADGIAVKKPSETTLKVVNESVDDVISVTDNEISHSIFMLLERCKLVVEPAGAVGLAALLNNKMNVEGKKVGVVLSGGNIDMSLLGRIIERSLYLESRFVKITGLLSDKRETLKDLLLVIATTRASVVSVEHERADPNISLGRMKVTITLEISRSSHLDELMNNLQKAGYKFEVVK